MASTPTSTTPTSTLSTTSTTKTTSSTTATPTTNTTPATTNTTPTTTATTTTPTTTTTTTTTTPTTTSTTTTPTPTSTTTTPTSTTTTPTPTSTTATTTTTPTTTTMTTTPTSTTTPTTITTTPTTTSTTTSTTLSTLTSTVTSTQTPTSTVTTSTTVLTVGPWIAPVNVPAGAQVCHEYLVSGPNGIPDSSLTASSQWNSHLPFDHNGPERARLFSLAIDFGNGTYYRGAWSAGVIDKNQYVQAEFRSPCLIRGIVTQGRHVNPNTLCCHQRVTQYNVLYSNDGNNWETIKDDQGKDKTFKGNLDQDSLVTQMLACPIIAKFIRINPVDWVTHIALRFDVIGCPTNTDNLGACPKGWLERPGSSTCYMFHTGSDVKSWDDAERYCLLEQSHLVEIDSVQERVRRDSNNS
ncbi:hypothetical protein ACJMK2_026757 [Sinanodonta woodiana]|uniref:F5/8 type C domain-containing protein n=1 Tax=Sinanodonta woodiana TaxID=1069815 RepID=A0ABD3XM68_SINWO